MAVAKKAQTGLCTKCKWAGWCPVLRDADKPILWCKGFNSHDYSVVMGVRLVPDPPQAEPSREEGLCRDCGNRDSCMFRKREGGMWHCEEYC